MQLRVVASVFRTALNNPALRRVATGYLFFRIAESGIWLAMLVYAYRNGGSTSSMAMVLVQIVPSLLLAPFLGAVADSVRPSRMLKTSYAIQTVVIVALTAALVQGAPVIVVFLIASILGLAMTTSRPSHAALLPAIVRVPNELTVANVMGGWADGAANLVGPAIVGVLYSVQGAPLALGVMGALTLTSLIALVGVKGFATAARISPASLDLAPFDGSHEGDLRGTPALRMMLRSVKERFCSNVTQILRTPRLGDLLVVHTFYYVLVGALDLLCVVVALKYLRLGSGGPGLLNASVGAGGLVAGAVIIFLVGRRRLAGVLTISIAVALVALAFIGAWRSVGLTVVLLVIVGIGGEVFDVAGQTLMQRSAPPDSIAGTFSVREACSDLGLALGAVLARVVLAFGGVKAALIAPAAVGLVIAAVLGRRLRSIDDAAVVPHVEIQLLRSLTLFAALPMQTIEGLAHRLEPVAVHQGTSVIVEGERGNLYYCVAAGELSVTKGNRALRRLKRGDGFGELALLRDVPRQATVTADVDSLLYRLDKHSFLQMISSSSMASTMADTVMEGYEDTDNY